VNQDKVSVVQGTKLYKFQKKFPPKWYGHEWRNGFDTGLPTSAECDSAFWHQ